MSTTKVQMPVKIENREEKIGQNERQRKEAYIAKQRHKHDNNNDGRKFTRKRAHSFAAGGGKSFFPPYKRRCKPYEMRPPTKFLLGGNIYDPLNLNSLQDERINREMNAATPKSSPLPTPKHRRGAIEVIIPPNVHDPLNLLTAFEDDAEYEQNLISPVKKGRKKNRKKKRNSLSGCSSKENNVEGGEGEGVAEEAPAMDTSTESLPTESAAETITRPEGGAVRNLDLPLRKDPPKDKPRKCSVKDKIVSPVVPQPRFWTRPHGHRHHQKPPPTPQVPNFKAKNAKYKYGNYNRYYGYRNQHHDVDVRLKVFSERRSLFADRDVLDIGCNVGHVTLSVARDLGARSVVGLDIDQHLVDVARRNVRHYVNFRDSPPSVTPAADPPKFYPISMPIVYGPVDPPGAVESPTARKKFPNNVTFVQGSYVLDSDSLLATEQAQFDVILCLSVTKWLHVNWGDSGLKQAFRRMFAQLRPGGKLILEAQGWDSYKKRKTLTETIYKNYHEIRFFPQKFTEYLLSEVGFSTCEILAVPSHPSKGFRRPIQLFTKGSFSSTYSAPGTPFYQSAARLAKPPVYTPVVVSTRSVEDEDDAFEPSEVGAGSQASDPFEPLLDVGNTSQVSDPFEPSEVGNSSQVSDSFEPSEVGNSSQVSDSFEPLEVGSSSQVSDAFEPLEGIAEETETEEDCGMDSFQGVVCVTDGNEAGSSDRGECASVSSPFTDASQTETQDSV